jgi:hypothetical protein
VPGYLSIPQNKSKTDKPMRKKEYEEVLYAANQMIELYGNHAEEEATKRIEQFRKIDSIKQAGFWLAVKKAVEEIRLAG